MSHGCLRKANGEVAVVTGDFPFPGIAGGKMGAEPRRETHPLPLLQEQRHVVDALRDESRYLMHPQSLAQSGIYLQIWANGELLCTGGYSYDLTELLPDVWSSRAGSVL